MPALTKPPVEVPRETSLEGLAPRFRTALETVLAQLVLKGFEPMVGETLRTHARQRFLFGFGREYDDGRGVVTYSEDADETWHGFGLAADIWDRRRLWNTSPEFRRALHAACHAHGLTWGGDWNRNGIADDRFADWPHVQWGKCRRSPSPKAARLVAEGGVLRLWAEVGAL